MGIAAFIVKTEVRSQKSEVRSQKSEEKRFLPVFMDGGDDSLRHDHLS
jgi:hypothetical protein